MRLKVVKADGNVTEYVHTKVVGTISNALAKNETADMVITEQLAEVVTYYLYHRSNRGKVTTGEIFSIIQAILADTGHEDAAMVLSEYHYKRKLHRSRTEVAKMDIEQLSDAQKLYETEQNHRTLWNKSKIVNDLIEKHNLSVQTARTVASLVEEKIFNIGVRVVSTGLVKQLVLSETAAVLKAETNLQTV